MVFQACETWELPSRHQLFLLESFLNLELIGAPKSLDGEAWIKKLSFSLIFFFPIPVYIICFFGSFLLKDQTTQHQRNNEHGNSDGGVWGGIFARGDLKWRLKIKEVISNLVIQWFWVILVVKCWSSLRPCLRTHVWRLNLFNYRSQRCFFLNRTELQTDLK